MLRLAAASAFACAAFAWVPPYIDRLGLVLLGLGAWALASRRVAVKLPPEPPPPLPEFDLPAIMDELRENVVPSSATHAEDEATRIR